MHSTSLASSNYRLFNITRVDQVVFDTYTLFLKKGQCKEMEKLLLIQMADTNMEEEMLDSIFPWDLRPHGN